MAPFTLPDPPQDQAEQARTASHRLFADAQSLGGKDGTLRVQVDASGDLVELPPMVTGLLRTILESMAAGRAISVVPMDAELTTQQAADQLGVSRPFLVKQLEDGQIPHRKVGKHRRVRVADLLAFQEHNQAERAKVLDDLVALSQEMGGYE